MVSLRTVKSTKIPPRITLQYLIWDTVLTVIVNFEAVLDVMEVVEVDLLVVVGVLQHDEVLPRERLVREQVLPVLGLDVELVHGLSREHVARRPDANDLRVIIEDLEGKGIIN